MSTLSSMVVKLTLDAGDYEKEISKTQRMTDSLVSGLSNIGGAVVLGGFTAAAGGAALLSGFLADCTSGAMEAEKIQAELAAVLKSTGGKAGVTAEAVNNLAGYYQSMTMFEDDAIVSGENMLLTFTNIGEDVFPTATEAMLNLTQKFGSMDGAATMLGKALNDPLTGVTALQRVGVTFSEEQKKQIQGFMKVSDVASAQKVILGELETEFGGLAEAAGNTAAGQMATLANEMGGIKDDIGAAFLPALTSGAIALRGFVDSALGNDELEVVTNGLKNLADTAAKNLPTFMHNFKIGVISVFDWLNNNRGVVIGVLSAIGLAVAAFGLSVATAAWAALSPLLPVIAVMAAVGFAAYALYEAWNANFGGIRDFVMEVWNAYLKPAFDYMVMLFQTNLPIAIQTATDFWNNVILPAVQNFGMWLQTILFPTLLSLFEWLQTNIPIAIQTLTDFWNTVLLPAIQNVWLWVQTVAIPIIQNLVDWLMTNIPVAIQTVTAFWNEVLLPAIQNVWTWVQTVAIPIIQDLFEWLQTNIPVAIQKLTEFWNNTLLPAIQNVWNWVQQNAFPIIQKLWDWLQTTIPAALTTLSNFWTQTLLPAITGVWDWMNTTLFPFFKGLNDFFTATFQKTLEALGGFWTNVLLPGLTKVYDYLNGNVFPIFKNIGDWLDKTFGPLLSNVGGWIKQYLLDSFERLTKLLQDAGVWLSNLARDIANLKLPDWLTGPTPNVTVPVPDTSGSGGSSGGSSSTNNGGNTYNNYTVNVEGGGDADAAEATSRAYQNAYGYGYGW